MSAAAPWVGSAGHEITIRAGEDAGYCRAPMLQSPTHLHPKEHRYETIRAGVVESTNSTSTVVTTRTLDSTSGGLAWNRLATGDRRTGTLSCDQKPVDR